MLVDGKFGAGQAGGLWLKLGDGKVFREVAEGRKVEIEEKGPMRAAVNQVGHAVTGKKSAEVLPFDRKGGAA